MFGWGLWLVGLFCCLLVVVVGWILFVCVFLTSGRKQVQLYLLRVKILGSPEPGTHCPIHAWNYIEHILQHTSPRKSKRTKALCPNRILTKTTYMLPAP